MLNAVVLIIIRVHVFILNAVVLIVVRVHVFIRNAIALNDIMLKAIMLNAVVLIVVRVHAFIPNVVLTVLRDIEEITSYTFSNHTWFYPSQLFRLNLLFSHFFAQIVFFCFIAEKYRHVRKIDLI
jgi:hypothetical protein